MPSVDVAMARSLKGSSFEIIARSMQAALKARGVLADAHNTLSDAKTAFSSWDNCMAVTYCKWLVIGLIIAGGLMLLSIIWCAARCLCCGLSCCCECCYCLKCCGNCCGCCDTPKSHRQKYLNDSYQNIPPSQGYHSEPSMTAEAIPPSRTKNADPPQYAQFATFDVSRKSQGEDSLPAMPTWEGSESKKLDAGEDVVELHDLKKPEANIQNHGMQTAAIPGGTSPPGASARNPQGPGPQVGQAAVSGYMGGDGPGGHGMNPAADPYTMHGQGYGQMHNGYIPSQASLPMEQSWEARAYAQPPTTASRYRDQRGYGEFAANGNRPDTSQALNPPRGGVGPAVGAGPRRSPAPRESPISHQHQDYGYGQYDPPQRSFSPVTQRSFSPAPQRSSPAPQRQYTADSAPTHSWELRPDSPSYRKYATDSPSPMAGGMAGRPPPQRQHTADPGPGTQSPGPVNNGGFDFQSGFSRPPTLHTFESSHAGASSAAEQQEHGRAYPGYKPYQPKR